MVTLLLLLLLLLLLTLLPLLPPLLLLLPLAKERPSAVTIVRFDFFSLGYIKQR